MVKRKIRGNEEVTFVEIKSKSKAGVEYIKYKQVFPVAPVGFNHLARRRLDAWNKKHG